MRLTACPSNSRGAPGSSRGNHGPSLDTRVATLFVHAGPRRSSHSRDRVAVPTGHGQSSPHRGGCRAPAGSYLRQTSFPRPVRSAKERLLSCVSWSALLSTPGYCDPDLLCANPLTRPKLLGAHPQTSLLHGNHSHAPGISIYPAALREWTRWVIR